MRDYSVVIERLEREVSELKRDSAVVSVIVNKLDATIDKLGDVSTSLSRLIAVHETRLESQERMGTTLANLIEKRKTEQDEKNSIFLAQIAQAEEKSIKKVEDILNSMSDEQKKNHEEMNARITKIERWIWIISGGSIAIGFIISQALGLLPLIF